MRSIESAIGFRDEDDANVLHRYMLDRLRKGKPEEVDQILRVLLDHMLDDKRWIMKCRKEVADAKAYILEIGRTVKAAGLRSYTDDKGRIFVAALDSGSEDK